MLGRAHRRDRFCNRWYYAIKRTKPTATKPTNLHSSYFCNPRGQIVAKASDCTDEVLIHDLDLEMNREVRNTWEFLHDRRPETYGELTQLLP